MQGGAAPPLTPGYKVRFLNEATRKRAISFKNLTGRFYFRQCGANINQNILLHYIPINGIFKYTLKWYITPQKM